MVFMQSIFFHNVVFNEEVEACSYNKVITGLNYYMDSFTIKSATVLLFTIMSRHVTYLNFEMKQFL